MCTARYEDVAPKLLELLERAAGGETFDDDEGRMFFRGLHIIGGHRDPLAFKPLLRVLRRPPYEVHDLLGDATSETLAQIVAGVFDGDIAALLDAIADLNIEETARDSLLGAATFLTWEGRIPRQEFVEFLERFHTERLAPEGDRRGSPGRMPSPCSACATCGRPCLRRRRRMCCRSSLGS